MSSSVDLGGHDVEARDQRHEVRDHDAAAHRLDEAHGVERAGPEARTITLFLAVTDDVAAHVAARALHAGVGLAGRPHLAGQLALDVALRVLLDLVERLAEDPRALLALLDAHLEA